MPPDPSHDYFALLGQARILRCDSLVSPEKSYHPITVSQPRHFDVPEPSLELAFKQAARSLHPDKFASRPEAERAASAAQASRLNAAYAALRSPLRRARYLLALRGDAPSRETEAGDPEDLEAQLEAREEAEAAKRDAPRLRSLAAKAEAAEAEALSSLRVAFAPGAAHDSSAAARAAVRALSYASKLGEEIREALHDAEAANHAAAEAAAVRARAVGRPQRVNGWMDGGDGEPAERGGEIGMFAWCSDAPRSQARRGGDTTTEARD